LAVVRPNFVYAKGRHLDILLEMDSHDLHLVDRHALNLRHDPGFLKFILDLTDFSVYVDGDSYASAALHCVSFLSNPSTYFGIDSPEMGEWKATCDLVLVLLCQLLPRANTSRDLVQFMSNYDIGLVVRQNFSVNQVDAHILAFLSRANVCVNWRIISAIRRALITTDEEPPSKRRKITPSRHLASKCKECSCRCSNKIY